MDVIYGGIQETLTINNFQSKLLGETLELSNITAKKLGFKEYGVGPCQVNFPGLTTYKNFIKYILNIFFPPTNFFHYIKWFMFKLDN